MSADRSAGVAFQATRTGTRADMVRVIALIVVGACLMTVAAKLKVPFWPVPVTLQTLTLPLIAAAFGARLGTAAMVAYLGAGMLGLPVFTGTPPAAAGPFYFFGPTGGYLLAYPLAAWIIGAVAEQLENRSFVALFAAMIAADIMVLFVGFVWLAFGAQTPTQSFGIGISAAWTFGVAPFLLADLVKIALAACLAYAGWRVMGRIRH